MVVSLKKEVEKRIEDVRKRFFSELSKEVKSRIMHPDVVTTLTGLVLGKITTLGGFFEGVDDPTDPTLTRYQAIIQGEIEKNLAASQASFSIGGTTMNLTITLLSDEFLGINTGGPTSPTDPTEMRWLYFFVVGGLGANLYWVPAESLNKLSTGLKSTHLGRFSRGLLIQPSSEESVRRKNEALSAAGAPPIVKHPQSGAPPNPNLFQSILTEQLIKRLIIDPALSVATQRVLKK